MQSDRYMYQQRTVTMLTAGMVLLVLLLLHGQPLFIEATVLTEDGRRSVANKPFCARNVTISNSSQANDCQACLEGHISCRSLLYAFTQCTILSYSTFYIKEGTHCLNGSLGTVYNTPFARGLTDVNIVGDGVNKTIIDGIGKYGFAFVNVSRLTISDLSFLSCSQTRPSTSLARVSEHSHSQPFQVGVYVWRCETVNISRVSIHDANAVGLVIYETAGAVTITDSLFLNNTDANWIPMINESSRGILPGGGGVNIEFPYCPPGHFNDSECGNSIEFVSEAEYTISNCLFKSNIAHTILEVQNQFILPNRSVHQAFGRGGGLAVYFSGGSNHVTMRVIDCNFIGNRAIYGAGVFAEFHDQSHNNSLSVTNCVFSNNYCHQFDSMNGAGGGGMRLAFVFYDAEELSVANNEVLVANNTFSGNKAYFGGGLSFLSGLEQNRLHATNKVILANNTWTKNTARLGSAAYFTAFNQVKIGVRPVIEIVSNTFRSNTILYVNSALRNYLAGSGTVYCYNMPLKLKGNNNFYNNTGTGLVVVGTHLHVFPHSTTIFTGNVASNGGAMAFYANGWINIHSNTTLLFANNTAHVRGGALYADMTGGNEILTSRDCFLHYNHWWISADLWDTSLVFRNNHAHGDGSGGDIFVSSVYPCIWGGSYGAANTSLDLRKKVFTWKSFHYGPPNHNASIGSGLSVIKWKEHHDPYSISIVPGQLHNFRDQFAMYNDLDKLTTTAMLASSSVNTGLAVAPDSTFTINTLRVLSRSSSTAASKVSNCDRIQLQSVSDPPMAIVFDVTALPCPPGAWLTPSSENSSLFECECASSFNDTGYLTGVMCSGSNFKFDIHVIKGYWVGHSHDNDSFYWITSPCPVDFCSTKAKFGRIQLDAGNITDEICAISRTGDICGQCKENYSLVATSPKFRCEKCSSSVSLPIALFKWFLIQFGTTTIIVGVILLFGINVSSGKFASFVFFCQVVPVLNLELCQCITNNENVWRFYNAMYSFWSLELSDHLYYIDVCLPGVSNPIILALLKYIDAFYPFVLLLLVAILAKCHKDYCGTFACRGTNIAGINPQRSCHRLRLAVRRFFYFLSQRTTTIQGIATCFVISYCKLTYLSLFILSPSYINYPHNVTVEPGAASRSTRVWYYGQWEYFGHPHMYFAIPAIIIFLLFVIFPLLILVSYPLLPNLLRKCNTSIADKVERFYRKAADEYIYHVLSIFQDSYKKNCKFFAVMWFLYRLALYFNNTFNSNIWSTLTVQIIMGMVFLFIHAVVQPYKERLYNIIDCFFLANIIFLSAITSQASQNDDTRNVAMYAAIIYVQLSLPIAYFAIVCFFVIITQIVSWVKTQRKLRGRGEGNPLIDPNEVDHDEQVNGNQQHQEDDAFYRPDLYQSSGEVNF